MYVLKIHMRNVTCDLYSYLYAIYLDQHEFATYIVFYCIETVYLRTLKEMQEKEFVSSYNNIFHILLALCI